MSMGNSWEERKKTKEEEYFQRKDKEVLSRLKDQKKQPSVSSPLPDQSKPAEGTNNKLQIEKDDGGNAADAALKKSAALPAPSLAGAIGKWLYGIIAR